MVFISSVIAGAGGTWTFRETLEWVRITNESDRDIEINNIDVTSSNKPLVWLNPDNSVPLTFTINAEVAPTLIEHQQRVSNAPRVAAYYAARAK